MTPAGLCSWEGRFESYLVANPEIRFSRDEANFFPKYTFSSMWLLFFLGIYRNNPKISDTQKFAVITLKVEQDGFSLE